MYIEEQCLVVKSYIFDGQHPAFSMVRCVKVRARSNWRPQVNSKKSWLGRTRGLRSCLFSVPAFSPASGFYFFKQWRGCCPIYHKHARRDKKTIGVKNRRSCLPEDRATRKRLWHVQAWNAYLQYMEIPRPALPPIGKMDQVDIFCCCRTRIYMMATSRARSTHSR